MGKVKVVLDQAKKLLKKQNYDQAHDLHHHQNVWKRAKQIADNIDFDGDMDLLHIACLWHDVLVKPYPAEIHKKHKTITNETAEYVRKLMLDNDFSAEDAETVFLAVKHHEFDDKPVNIEGKVLFDADKLDVFSMDRIRRVVRADKQGKIPQWKVKSAIVGAKVFVKHMRSKLHFDYSKHLFDKKMTTFFNDQEIQEYAKKYGVDLVKLEKDIKRNNFLDNILNKISYK